MDTTTDDHPLPIFPATAPPVFADPPATVGLLAPVLDALAGIVDVDTGRLGDPTPCSGYDVAQLRQHVLAWLQFFAQAVDDVDGRTDRIDPETWILGSDDIPSTMVARCSTLLTGAIEAGVHEKLVVMSQARMAGGAVVAMALGEYIVHGWDLAVATGRPWLVDDAAADAARTFLEATVAPEHRGPASGFFDEVVAIDDDAPALDRLLGFTGRDPAWTP